MVVAVAMMMVAVAMMIVGGGSVGGGGGGEDGGVGMSRCLCPMSRQVFSPMSTGTGVHLLHRLLASSHGALGSRPG